MVHVLELMAEMCNRCENQERQCEVAYGALDHDSEWLDFNKPVLAIETFWRAGVVELLKILT